MASQNPPSSIFVQLCLMQNLDNFFEIFRLLGYLWFGFFRKFGRGKFLWEWFNLACLFYFCLANKALKNLWNWDIKSCLKLSQTISPSSPVLSMYTGSGLHAFSQGKFPVLLWQCWRLEPGTFCSQHRRFITKLSCPMLYLQLAFI